MTLRPSHFVVALTLALLLPSCTMPGGAELAIIALVVLLMFGGAKLPKLMRGMGSGITEFKKGLKEGDGDDDTAADDTAADDTAADDSESKSDED
ncbi:MAG: twin-arginine translocase TatA/TatE family subunit [Planctomycetota bacterium]|nr:twin-arginine translocase TatA/TatE family subunit [Planctomycetota bacterium]